MPVLSPRRFPLMVNETGQRNTCSIVQRPTEQVAMKNSNARRMSAADEATLWRCWHGGQSLHRVPRVVGIAAVSVHQYLAKHSGYCSSSRRRRRISLTVEEREEISRCVAADWSVRAMARRLDGHPSAVSRELRRNGGRESYRVIEAEHSFWDRARQPKRCRLG